MNCITVIDVIVIVVFVPPAVVIVVIIVIINDWDGEGLKLSENWREAARGLLCSFSCFSL